MHTSAIRTDCGLYMASIIANYEYMSDSIFVLEGLILVVYSEIAE